MTAHQQADGDDDLAAVTVQLKLALVFSDNQDGCRIATQIVGATHSGQSLRWCAAPTVYNRFNRWSKDRIWQDMLGQLVKLDESSLLCIDSTTSKAHRCSAGGKRGASAQAIGRSRGGRTSKIYAICDAAGRIVAVQLSPGQMGDVRAAVPLLEPLPPAKQVLGDAAYDSDALRLLLIERGSTPVIQPNARRKNIPPFETVAYKRRNLIERRVLTPEGLAPGGNTIRQAGKELQRNRPPRHARHLVDVIESRA